MDARYTFTGRQVYVLTIISQDFMDGLDVRTEVFSEGEVALHYITGHQVCSISYLAKHNTVCTDDEDRYDFEDVSYILRRCTVM